MSDDRYQQWNIHGSLADDNWTGEVFEGFTHAIEYRAVEDLRKTLSLLTMQAQLRGYPTPREWNDLLENVRRALKQFEERTRCT